jgi:hypothetical protein
LPSPNMISDGARSAANIRQTVPPTRGGWLIHNRMFLYALQEPPLVMQIRYDLI